MQPWMVKHREEKLSDEQLIESLKENVRRVKIQRN